MKSRISFFDATVFKKNTTRFAPVWGLYTLCLIMGMLLMADSGTDFWFLSDMAECIQVMMVVNFFYAIIVVLLLFGDLYNTRMCYALHAMPLRRETWFGTNVASGLAFSLVPTLIMTVPALALSLMAVNFSEGWQVPLYWFLASNLGYLFFFALAVLCAFCAGSRFSALVIYGIANFLSLVAFALVDTLYTPFLYGVETWEAPFYFLCPLGTLRTTELVSVNRIWHDAERISWTATMELGDWYYLIGCALLGIGLLWLALVLYRRRKLETAGEFIALKSLRPVFLVIFTLSAGVLLYYAVQIFIGAQDLLTVIYLVLGLVVGWFAGQMLLQRTVRVFRKRTFAGCGILAAILLLSMGINALDPFGIESWVPAEEEVRSVTLNLGHYRSNNASDISYYDRDEIHLTDEQDIRRIIRLQELDLKAAKDREQWGYTGHYGMYHTINYHLTDGRTVSRFYEWDGKPGEMDTILRGYFSSLGCILGVPEEADLPIFAQAVRQVQINDENVTELLTTEDILSLAEAIAADCAAGNMVQRGMFHEFHTGGCDARWNIELHVALEELPWREDEYVQTAPGYYVATEEYYGYDRIEGLYLSVWDCCENTLQWLEEHDMLQYAYDEYIG